MKIEISKFLILIFTVFAVTSCQTSKDLPNLASEDCSMIFTATTSNAAIKNIYGRSNVSQCKILPLQINPKTKCEISGSNKIDKLVHSYIQNPGDNIFFMAPLEAIHDMVGDMSYGNKIKYYFISQQVKGFVDSDLFESLKDFRYKGMNCVVDGKKFISWISYEKVIIIYEEGRKSDASKSIKKPVKKRMTGVSR